VYFAMLYEQGRSHIRQGREGSVCMNIGGKGGGGEVNRSGGVQTNDEGVMI
jgi:hypothetical protein